LKYIDVSVTYGNLLEEERVEAEEVLDFNKHAETFRVHAIQLTIFDPLLEGLHDLLNKDTHPHAVLRLCVQQLLYVVNTKTMVMKVGSLGRGA
jgi:hypothetical protein